jgi:hypothetical protein
LKKFFLTDEVLRNQILRNLELDKIIEKIDQLKVLSVPTKRRLKQHIKVKEYLEL